VWETSPASRARRANSHLYRVRRFCYDTAGSANELMLQALKVGGLVIVVFGSDFPFAPL
jgi:hypothetical protein